MTWAHQLPALFQHSSFDRQIDGLLDEAIRSVDQWNSAWAPQCNVYEDTDSFCVQIAVPGLNANDIVVQVQDQTLSVRGERKVEEYPDRTWHTRELKGGAFVSTFLLPAYVDTSNSSASYKEGMLTVRLSKNEKAKARRIIIG
jgi:HSP20 family protein